jgi:hypothetical protein
MSNDDFLHHFTVWLAKHQQTYHIPTHLLYQWRKLTGSARHKAFGIPIDSEVFTDGVHCLAVFDLHGLTKTALCNWVVDGPKNSTYKTSKKKKPTKPTLVDAILANIKL